MQHYALFKSTVRTPWAFPYPRRGCCDIFTNKSMTQKLLPWGSDFLSHCNLNDAKIGRKIGTAKRFRENFILSVFFRLILRFCFGRIFLVHVLIFVFMKESPYQYNT